MPSLFIREYSFFWLTRLFVVDLIHPNFLSDSVLRSRQEIEIMEDISDSIESMTAAGKM